MTSVTPNNLSWSMTASFMNGMNSDAKHHGVDSLSEHAKPSDNQNQDTIQLSHASQRDQNGGGEYTFITL
ncbi:MAG: hypothetical protein IJ934_00100 [Acetobacter sp.]|nr:hypothetical protein [Acetobacter sp.]